MQENNKIKKFRERPIGWTKVSDQSYAICINFHVTSNQATWTTSFVDEVERYLKSHNI